MKSSDFATGKDKKTASKGAAKSKETATTEPKAPLTPEAKADNFVRIAERRAKNVLRQLNNLGNCSNKATYVYTPEQVEKIFGAIKEKVSSTEKRFAPKEKAKDETFSLK